MLLLTFLFTSTVFFSFASSHKLDWPEKHWETQLYIEERCAQQLFTLENKPFRLLRELAFKNLSEQKFVRVSGPQQTSAWMHPNEPSEQTNDAGTGLGEKRYKPAESDWNLWRTVSIHLMLMTSQTPLSWGKWFKPENKQLLFGAFPWHHGIAERTGSENTWKYTRCGSVNSRWVVCDEPTFSALWSHSDDIIKQWPFTKQEN